MCARRENSLGGGNTRSSCRTDVILGGLVLSITGRMVPSVEAPKGASRGRGELPKRNRQRRRRSRPHGFWGIFPIVAERNAKDGFGQSGKLQKRKSMKKQLIILGAALALVGCDQQKGGTGTDTDTSSGGYSGSSSTNNVRTD